MNNVYDVLQRLKSTTKRNEKIEILKSVKDNPTLEYLFKRVARLTYHPEYNFWIKDVQYEDKSGTLFDEQIAGISLDVSLDFLEYSLATRELTGNAAYDKTVEIHSTLSDEDQYVFECIIDRDLKCGVSSKTINKVWPDLIYDHPYMRASSFNKKNISKINFPCISQTKEDGGYEDIIIDGEYIEVRSRYGSLHNNHLSHSLFSILHNEIRQSVVLMGEVLVFKDDSRKELMPRQEGNGYLNRSEVDPNRLLHVLWDIVPLEDFVAEKCSVPYSERFEMLKNVVSRLTKKTDQIKLIDSRVVNDVDEVIAHFKENAEMGLEGTVVKNMDMKWKSGTSRDQVKVKIVFDCEVKIVGFNQAKELGQYVEKLGSFTVQSSDGKFEFNVGTGFSDEQREKFWKDRLSLLKKIITIKGNDITTSELKPDKYAVYLPRFDKIRNDKTQADSYDRIKEQRDSFLETLAELEE